MHFRKLAILSASFWLLVGCSNTAPAPSPMSSAGTAVTLTLTPPPRPPTPQPIDVHGFSIVGRDAEGAIMAPTGGTRTFEVPIGPFLPGTTLRASVDARVTEQGVREIAPCGSFRRIFAGGWVRLDLLDAETGAVLVSRQTRSPKWTRLAISYRNDFGEHPTRGADPVVFRLEIEAGVPPAQSVTYNSMQGARCERRTVQIAPPGVFRLPSVKIVDAVGKALFSIKGPG